MSFSDPVVKIENPVDEWVYWGGKEEGNMSVQVEEHGEFTFKVIPFPQEFILLDSEVAQIRGKSGGGIPIRSNLIRTTFDSPNRDFRVYFAKGSVIAYGPWKEIKAKVKEATEGGRADYTRLMFLLAPKSGKIVCMYLRGRAAMAYSKWSRYFNELEAKLRITGWEMSEKDSYGQSPVPTFEAVPGLTDAEREMAIEADKRLQEYLNERFKTKDQEEGGEEAGEVEAPVQATQPVEGKYTVEEIAKKAVDFDSVESGCETWKIIAVLMEESNFGPTDRHDIMKAIDGRFDIVSGEIGRYRCKDGGAVDDTADDLPF